jgi:hypothetical protein
MTLRRFIDAARLTARYASLLVAGAAIYAYYLESTLPLAPPEVGQFWRSSVPILLGLNLIGFRTAQEQTSVLASIMLIGIVSGGYLALNYQTTANLLIGGAIILGGMGFMYLIYRIEERGGQEIDEARFGPDGKPLGPWQPPKG